MRKIKTLLTLILSLTMIFGCATAVFAADKNDVTKDWNFYTPGEVKTITMCECDEDEDNNWAYIKGTEHFYEADFKITELFVDPEGKDKTTYEFFAELDNSNRNFKLNSWINADGVIDLKTIADVRDNKNNKVDYVKEKDQSKDKKTIYYHFVVTAPNDMDLVFYYNGGLMEEHKEVKLIGNLYNGLSKGITDDSCILMKLSPDMDKYPSEKKAEVKKDSNSSKKSLSVTRDKYGEDNKISMLEYKKDSKSKKVDGTENFFDANARVTSYKAKTNSDGSVDYNIVLNLDTSNHNPSCKGFGFYYGIMYTNPLSVIDSSSKTALGMGKKTEGDNFIFTYKAHVAKEDVGNVAIYLTTELPDDYGDVDQIAKLPKELSRAFWDGDIFYLVLDPALKDYSE